MPVERFEFQVTVLIFLDNWLGKDLEKHRYRFAKLGAGMWGRENLQTEQLCCKTGWIKPPFSHSFKDACLNINVA